MQSSKKLQSAFVILSLSLLGSLHSISLQKIEIDLYSLERKECSLYKPSKPPSFALPKYGEVAWNDIEYEIIQYSPKQESYEKTFFESPYWDKDLLYSLRLLLKQRAEETYLQDKKEIAMIVLQEHLGQSFSRHENTLSQDLRELSQSTPFFLNHSDPTTTSKKTLRKSPKAPELASDAFSEFVDTSSISLKATPTFIPKEYRLKNESYPDYSIGSSLWTKDMLQAFIYLTESYYTDALLKGKSATLVHHYSDGDLAIFLNTSLKKVDLSLLNFHTSYLQTNHFGSFEKEDNCNLILTPKVIISKKTFEPSRSSLKAHFPLKEVSLNLLPALYLTQDSLISAPTIEPISVSFTTSPILFAIATDPYSASYIHRMPLSKGDSLPLERLENPIKTRYSQKGKTFSYPTFAKIVSKRDIVTTKWLLPHHKEKTHKLKREEKVVFELAFKSIALQNLPPYQTPHETLDRLIPKELKITPELFSVHILVTSEPTLIAHSKTFASVKETSSLLLPKTSLPYPKALEGLALKRSWKASRESSSINKFNQSLPTTSFKLAPPETGKHALLYPIAQEEYLSLGQNYNESIPIGQKETFVKEKLINTYLEITRMDVKSPKRDPFFFGDGYVEKYGSHIENSFNLVVTKTPPNPLPRMENLGKVNLVNIHNLVPITQNYAEGITLLEIRYPSSFSAVVEDAKLRNRTYRCTGYNLAAMPSISDIHTESASDDFIVSTTLAPQTSEEGYIFSLNLSLKETIERIPFRHHVYFLIDRSSSIEHHRFDVFKNAVSNAITFLGEQNFFNIFMFDNKVEALSPTDLRSTRNSIKMAKDFLDKQTQPWLSSNSTLLDLLEIIKGGAKESNDLYSVIILTNGSSLKSIDHQKEALKNLIDTPKDNFFVHTTAIGPKNQIAMLDLLSGLCRGSFLYSPTHAAFPRKLSVLMKQIKQPIITDLRITLLDDSPSIKFYHNPRLSSYLCKNRPFSFIGTTKELTEFDVLIQGRVHGHWVNIKKHVNLAESIRGRAKLERGLALQQVYTHCSKFLETNDQGELTSAENLIKSCGIDSP